MRCSAGAVWLIASLAAFFARGADESAAYLAPADRLVYRLTLSDGQVRDFRGEISSSPSVMRSADGWKLKFRGNGMSAVVTSPTKDIRYEFDRGRLVRRVDATGERRFPYGMNRPAPADVVSPLAFYEFEEGYVDQLGDRQLSEKWKGANRLQFPNVNPNRSGAFYVLLALLGVSFLFSPRRGVRIAGSWMAALSALAVIWTGSRGSMLGLFVGLIPFAVVVRFGFLRNRWFWIASGIFLVALAVWFGVVNSGSLMRGFTSKGFDWGNAIRLDMWKVAPKMMFDAPGGWAAAGPGSGRAYFDWYQRFDAITLAGNLMNDHLTVLADVGWLCRWGYVFFLLLVFATSAVELVVERKAFPLAVFSSLSVMSWLNPVYGAWTTWIVPSLALWALVAGTAKRIRPKLAFRCVGAAAVLSVVAIAVLWHLGSERPDGEVRVAADGPRVFLKTSAPDVWVVDDEQGALGSMYIGRDIREFYARFPHAPAIGFVRSISALPERRIGRLVLSGKAAQDWLFLLSENEEARRRLPREVIMITPPFAPSEIPEGVLACCKLRVVVGEFAARFQDEYANPPAFVTIVPAMERYVFGWMSFAVGD